MSAVSRGETVAEPTADPAEPNAPAAQLVEHFFRHETARLHATLIRTLGVQNITLAEDVAQEAMLRALRTWSMGGMPANPSGWITRVAMNLARDVFRHQSMAAGKEADIITHLEQNASIAPPVQNSETEIRDDALRLMFVCCHPSIAPDAQVVLALKVLCGFSTAEIARAFLSSEAAIEKQLTRTKQRIQEANLGFEIPEGEDLAPRLDGVLTTLYLLFNEGYKASSGDRLLREDLCDEAIRLTSLLVAHPVGDTPRAHALLALMLLSSARFPTRVDESGDLLRLDEQDRSRWDQSFIARGLAHLAEAASGDELTAYHLQAGIAACHCTANNAASTDWRRILRLYDDLLRLRPSPVIALNRAVAVANLYGPRAGLEGLAAIPHRHELESHYLFHAVAGELQTRSRDYNAAVASFRRAFQLSEVGPEQAHLTRMLQRAEAAMQPR